MVKAKESSLYASPAPDTPSSSLAMGDHCTNSPPLDPSERSSGEIVKLSETEVYISKPGNSESHGTCLLLLLTNGVGLHSVNNQVQADYFAKAGYFVAMPDLFHGDPAPNAASVTAEAEEDMNLLDQIKMKAVEGIKGFMIDMWLARHTPENTMPIIDSVLKEVQEKYGDKSYTISLGTYVVGYCFGGKYALRLAGTDKIVAAAVAHPTMTSKEDIEGVKQPITFACVEGDPHFPDDFREEARQFFKEHKLEHEMRVYKDVPHGFAVYGSYPDYHIKSSQEEAFEQFVQFLDRH
ncbi:Alpha/Beta hydrolase protein [Sphaerosporella brunnea]|uniref:Alpha/Beta hydrolase protein n=1 Tax=Sphaerosporella brunnea TaxID=1250544 RepID=A0A5J5ERZ5_9PEZI|nr:Alpha/Beta hydrolase protein [Sphaerosporella brunnea]